MLIELDRQNVKSKKKKYKTEKTLKQIILKFPVQVWIYVFCFCFCKQFYYEQQIKQEKNVKKVKTYWRVGVVGRAL